MDAELKELVRAVLEGQSHTEKSIGTLAGLVTSHVELSESRNARIEAAHVRTEEAIANLSINVDKYVASADARMRRIEENLDGLIRAITREHMNGKSGGK